MSEANLPETIRLVNGERIIEPAKYQIGDEMVDAIIARDLWNWLRSRADYSTWFKQRVSEAQLTENVDYSLLHSKMEQTGRGGRNRKDYAVTIDTAMHMAMMEQTERGREIRQDLIDWKKKAKAMMRAKPAVDLNDAATLRGLLLNYSERVLELEGEIVELKPDAESMKMLRAAEDAITMTAMSKILKVKRPWLFETMTEAGWFYVQNGTHLPYAPLLNRGYLTMGIAKKDPILRSDGRVQIVASTLVTPKGIDAITRIVRYKLANMEMTIGLAKTIMKIKAEDDARGAEDDAREAEEDRAILDRLNHDDRIYGSGD